jgi:hypothetical protein
MNLIFTKHQVPIQGQMENELELLFSGPNIATDRNSVVESPNITADPNSAAESLNSAAENLSLEISDQRRFQSQPLDLLHAITDPNTENLILEQPSPNPRTGREESENGTPGDVLGRSHRLSLARLDQTESEPNAKESGINFWIEMDVSNEKVIQSEPQPHGSDFLEDTHEVNSQNSNFTLSPRTNQGKPPNGTSLKMEKAKK